MQLAYPVRLSTDHSGSVLVSFPGVPEALTGGATEREALAEAENCLIAASGGYIDGRRDIPLPSPASVSAKISLYRATRDCGLSNGALAGRFGDYGRGCATPDRSRSPVTKSKPRFASSDSGWWS